MNYEFKRIKKRQYEDVSDEEIKDWAEKIAAKLRNMGENALYINAASEVLPKNLDLDARRDVDRAIVRELPADVSEMIKAKNVKKEKINIIADAMRRGAWKAEMDEAKIAAGKGKGSRRITLLAPKNKKKNKPAKEENQLDLFT